VRFLTLVDMKWFVAVFVLGLAACVMSDEPKRTCDPLAMLHVKRQWQQAFGDGEHRLEFALHLFNHIFKDYPKAREMISAYRGDNVHSPVFQAHAQRILNALTMLIETEDDPEALAILEDQVKKNLAATGIKPEFYDAFRDELLDTLPEYLEIHLDWDAWHACLDAIIDVLHK